jgi:hypothetical protein
VDARLDSAGRRNRTGRLEVVVRAIDDPLQPINSVDVHLAGAGVDAARRPPVVMRGGS